MFRTNATKNQNSEKTKRVKVVTGLKCNIKCVFCYYRDSLKAPNRTREDIVADLRYARKQGITEVDFSGGEPTVHPDLCSLIESAQSIGMKKISIISNGWELAEKDYLLSLKEAGLGEVLFSVHGSKATIHDGLTKTKGSFRKIEEALSNAVEAGLVVRSNTVISKLNYWDLPNFCTFIQRFSPTQVNFITINDWCFAKSLVGRLMLKYGEMSPLLQEACHMLEGNVPLVNVRYIPFCFMRGYERFVCNNKQVMFDPYEWVPRVRTRLEPQNNFFRYIGILGYGLIAGGAMKNVFSGSFSDLMDDAVIDALRHWNYKRRGACQECCLSPICDGVENTYSEIYGLEDLSPMAGVKVHNPLFFKKETSHRKDTP